jgi:hypothetical protein
MAHPPFMHAVFEAQRTLLLNQRQLGELLGTSERTVQRWSAGHGAPYHEQLVRLAAAVYPVDPDVAHRLASAMGQSLEKLGVVAPPAPAQPPPSVASSPLASLLVESVVSATAEALDVSPRVARPGVLAAMERAKTANLSVDDLLAVLRPPAVKRAKS